MDPLRKSIRDGICTPRESDLVCGCMHADAYIRVRDDTNLVHASVLQVWGLALLAVSLIFGSRWTCDRFSASSLRKAQGPLACAFDRAAQDLRYEMDEHASAGPDEEHCADAVRLGVLAWEDGGRMGKATLRGFVDALGVHPRVVVGAKRSLDDAFADVDVLM